MNLFIGSKALTTKPSSVILSDYDSFSTMCHEMKVPILITHNGESDLIVMSHKTYDHMFRSMKFDIELFEADCDLNSMPTIPAEKVFSRLREILDEQVCS